VERSTRLSILEHALADVVERLRELPPSRDAESLQQLARHYEGELSQWAESPPDEAKRSSLLKAVLDLNVEVIRAGGGSARGLDGDDGDGDGDGDDDYPKPV
jgi:hypothetical protein